MPRLLCCLVVTLLLPSQQPRDPATMKGAGTGAIRGIVVDALTSAPIAGVRVTLFTFVPPRSAPRPHYRNETVASEDGRFEFLDVPGGDFVVVARPGELRASHLSRTVGHNTDDQVLAPSLRLAPGEVRENMRIELPRALAIEGRVINEFGEPMSNVSVSARSGRGPVGHIAQTDDRGFFRVFALPPGAYTLCAESENLLDSGTVPPRLRYGRSCNERAVPLNPGETPDVVLHLRRTATFSITGSLMSDTGAAVAHGTVLATRRSEDGRLKEYRADVRSGSFTLGGLSPGEYTIRANAYPAMGAGPSHPSELASLRGVRIDGADLVGLTLTLAPPATVRGRVLARGPAASPRPSGTVVRLTPPLQFADLLTYGTPNGHVRPDGSFEIGGVRDAQVVTVHNLPPEWYVDTIRHGGEDILGRAREFSAGDSREVEVIISDGAADLRVQPVDDRDRPVESAEVVLLPADPTRWAVSPYLDQLRRSPYTDFRGRRPGDYLVVALRPGELIRALSEVPVVEPIARIADKVTLRAGEQHELKVRVQSLEIGK